MSRKSGRFAVVNADDPSAFAICDRCGFLYNQRDLTWQYEWGGVQLYNKRVLVCTVGNRCYDFPQEQLRTIILPPDPLPIRNPRTPYYAYEEQTTRTTQFATIPGNQPPWGAGPQMTRATQFNNGDQARVIQYLTQTASGQAPIYGPDG